jgi:hypothetical protein
LRYQRLLQIFDSLSAIVSSTICNVSLVANGNELYNLDMHFVDFGDTGKYFFHIGIKWLFYCQDSVNSHSAFQQTGVSTSDVVCT